MSKSPKEKLSRREQQIMDVIFKKDQATVSEVLSELASPPSYSAVRATLGILEEKGHLRHRKDGRRFVYFPTQTRQKAGRTALEHILTTFFDGAAESAVATLLELNSSNLSADELKRIRTLIEDAEKEGR